MHGEYNETAQQAVMMVDSGSHKLNHIGLTNQLLIIVVMSKAEIISMIDADGAGLGAYSAEITVDANAGSSTSWLSKKRCW